MSEGVKICKDKVEFNLILKVDYWLYFQEKKIKLTLRRGEKTKSEWTREINTGLWREDRTLIEGSGTFLGP